jgi:hypothetical protein
MKPAGENSLRLYPKKPFLKTGLLEYLKVKA